jgi:hypothetical protein
MGCDNPDPTVQTLAELLLPRWQVLAVSGPQKMPFFWWAEGPLRPR